jgi:hypothetical protein
MKLEFSGQILEKYSVIKCHGNPPSVSRTVACGRTDEHEATSGVSDIYERDSKRRNVTGLLTIKGAGLPEVQDARQTQHTLTPDSRTINILHILACHMNPNLTQHELYGTS